MTATNGMLRKIRVLCKRLELDPYQFCGVESLSPKRTKMTTMVAGAKIRRLEELLAEQGRPNLPPSRISGDQRAKVLRLRHLLEWHPVRFWRWARRVIGHHVPIRNSEAEKFNWCTVEDGVKMIEGLKAIAKRDGKL